MPNDSVFGSHLAPFDKYIETMSFSWSPNEAPTTCIGFQQWIIILSNNSKCLLKHVYLYHCTLRTWFCLLHCANDFSLSLLIIDNNWTHTQKLHFGYRPLAFFQRKSKSGKRVHLLQMNVGFLCEQIKYLWLNVAMYVHKWRKKEQKTVFSNALNSKTNW